MSFGINSNVTDNAHAGTFKAATPTPPPVTPSLPANNTRVGEFRQNAPMSYRPSSGILLKLRDKIQKTLETNAHNPSQFKLLTLDNQPGSGLYYSSIVVCMMDNAVSPARVIYYTLLLAASNADPKDRNETILGQQIQIDVVPGEAYDVRYVAKVQEAVNAAFPADKVQLLNLGATIVPENFNPEDESAVYRLCYHTTTVLDAEMKYRSENFQDVNLGAARGDNSLQVSVLFGRNTVQNSVSEPMRADIEVQFASVSQGQNDNASLNTQAAQNTSFGKVIGFVDPVWAPVVPAQGMNWGAYNPAMMMQLHQKYAARFVITHMETTEVSTLAAHLMLLLTTMPLSLNNTWYQAFYNQRRFDKKPGEDLTDVGMLNIEANLPTPTQPNGDPSGVGKRIDTAAKDFTPDAFGRYMQQLFRDGLLYAIDVPLCGPQTAYLDVFLEAANGNPNARRHILDTANALTCGEFEKVFNSTNNQDIFIDGASNMIQLGHYDTAEGGQADIRDIDQLAVVCGFGERDISVARKWSDSFLQTARPIQQRLNDRRQIIQALTKNRAVITGMAVRLTFTDHFLKSLNAAASRAGLNIRTNIPMAGLGAQVERGVASYAGSALVPSNFNSVFHSGGMGVNPNQQVPGYNVRQYNRWAGY